MNYPPPQAAALQHMATPHWNESDLRPSEALIFPSGFYSNPVLQRLLKEGRIGSQITRLAKRTEYLRYACFRV
jgi:hypothetical protein